MGRAYALAECIDEIRARLHLPDTAYPLDLDIQKALNHSIARVYNQVVSVYDEDEYIKEVGFRVVAHAWTDVAGAGKETWPTSHCEYFKIPDEEWWVLDTSTWSRIVDVQIDSGNGSKAHLKPWAYGDKDQSIGIVADPYRLPDFRYRIRPTAFTWYTQETEQTPVLCIEPYQQAVGLTGRVYYIPEIYGFSFGEEGIVGYQNAIVDKDHWVDLAMTDTCVRIRMLQRLDPTDFKAEYQNQLGEYIKAVQRRKRALPVTMVRRVGW